MTPITRLEKWIAPRAVPLLAVISVLIVGIGVAAYFVRQGDLNRVERLERVILCQHSHECREFVERAIREILRQQREPNEKPGDEGTKGITFRLKPGTPNQLQVSPDFGAVATPDTGGGQSPGQKGPPQSPEPQDKPESRDPGKDTPQGIPSPSAPSQGRSEPMPREAAPIPVEEPDPPARDPISSAAEQAEEVLEGVGQGVKELPCTALREVHDLC